MRQHEELSDRRRLRNDSYDEIERATVVIHVPAPERFGGTNPHRELQHAVNCNVPVALLVALEDRRRLDVGLPSSDRIGALAALTGGVVVERLADIGDVAAALAARRRQRA